MGNVLSGMSYYRKVPQVLLRHGLWPYQFLPAVISLVLGCGLFVSFGFIAQGISGWIDARVELENASLDRAVTIGAWVLSFVAMAAGFLFVHKHVVLILLSPFLGKIAEETVKAVKGEEFAESELTFTQSLVRSTRVNLMYIFRELLTNLLFLALGVIPLIGSLVSAVGMFATQSKFLGYGLMDFPLEHRGLSMTESIAFVRKRDGLSMGLGAGYLLMMLVPLVGWMFAPTFGTVAGTLAALDELEREGPSTATPPDERAIAAK